MPRSKDRRHPGSTLLLSPLPESVRVSGRLAIADRSGAVDHRHSDHLGAVKRLFDRFVCRKIAQAQRADHERLVGPTVPSRFRTEIGLDVLTFIDVSGPARTHADHWEQRIAAHGFVSRMYPKLQHPVLSV